MSGFRFILKGSFICFHNCSGYRLYFVFHVVAVLEHKLSASDSGFIFPLHSVHHARQLLSWCEFSYEHGGINTSELLVHFFSHPLSLLENGGER